MSEVEKKHKDLAVTSDLSECAAEDAVNLVREMFIKDKLRYPWAGTLYVSIINFRVAAYVGFLNDDVAIVRLDKSMSPNEWRIVFCDIDGEIEYSAGSPGA